MPPEDNGAAGASTGTPGTATDPNQNLKAEFNRKFDTLADSNKALQQKLDSLLAAVTPAAPVVKVESKKPDLYTDPDGYAAAIRKEAVEEATNTFNQLNSQQQAQANAVGTLYGAYPELQDSENPFTKAVIERHKQHSRQEQQDPRMLRLTALEVAAEMGVLPATKRGRDLDNPIYQRGGAAAREREVVLDDKTVSLAQLMGLDTSKKEVLDSLKARSKNLTGRR